MSTNELILAIVAMFGWFSAALMFGLWLGERKTRELMWKTGVFGTPVVPPAEVWQPGAPMEVRGPRLVEDEDAIDMTWSEETIEKGIADLRQQYHDAGVPVTPEALREEVMLMLNSDNGQMG